MALAVLAAAVPVSAQALSQSYHLNIPREPLDGALKDLAQQTGLQIAHFSDVKGSNALVGPVTGDMSVARALTSLLSSSGLTYRVVNDRTIAVVPLDSASGSAGTTSNSSQATPSAPATGDDTRKEGKSDSSGQFRLAQAASGQAPNPSPVGSQQRRAQGSEGALQVVIVTAEKRNERLQDVPVPVTSISADTLLDNDQVRLKDYYTQVPGLNLTTGVRGDTQLSIRGLSSGLGTIPTVGVTIDDVPYGSSIALTGGFSIADVDPSDVARIEVLRGPQGTLYGANSVGGLLKYVTIDPSTEGVSGLLEAGVNDVYNASAAGYNARAAVNVPLGDTVAIRASGFSRRIPGYIDNITTGQVGANQTDTDGGRLAFLWRPSADLSLKLSALTQDNRLLGSQLVNLGPGLGDLQQNNPNDTGWLTRRIEAYSSLLNARFGQAEFVSATGYNVSDQSIAAKIGPNTSPLAIFETLHTNKFSQELRLSTPVGQQVDFLMGGFYTREKSADEQNLGSVDFATSTLTASLFDNKFPVTYEEYAAFTDVTYKFTDRLDLQVGGRETQYRQSYSLVSTGPAANNPPIVPERQLTADYFTYLLTPRFKVSPDFMVYTRFASGYRPGSFNTGQPTLPLTYKPDTTMNYEVGAKGDFLDHALSIDMSVYYIDWKDIQILVIQPPPAPPGGDYFANAGSAKSQGVEFSFQARPIAHLTLTGWAAYTDATLTADFPPGPSAGHSGDRLPFSAPLSGNLAATEDFPLQHGLAVFAGAMLSYVGDRKGDFVASSLTRQSYPAYAEIDLRTGLEGSSWKVNLFLNNAADKRGAVTGDPTVIPSGIVYIQPRTVGMSVSQTF